MNDNQNYFVTRSTSRVLAIPGGKCSIDIFGDDAAEPPKPNPSPAPAGPPPPTANEAALNKRRAMGESFDLFGGDDGKNDTTVGQAPLGGKDGVVSTKPGTDSDVKPKEEVSSAGAPTKNAISSNQFASSATTNSYNVITARPTSRVLQEPGGKSEDFIFG